VLDVNVTGTQNVVDLARDHRRRGTPGRGPGKPGRTCAGCAPRGHPCSTGRPVGRCGARGVSGPRAAAGPAAHAGERQARARGARQSRGGCRRWGTAVVTSRERQCCPFRTPFAAHRGERLDQTLNRSLCPHRRNWEAPVFDFARPKPPAVRQTSSDRLSLVPFSEKGSLPTEGPNAFVPTSAPERLPSSTRSVRVNPSKTSPLPGTLGLVIWITPRVGAT
jgi:hypothetical protein